MGFEISPHRKKNNNVVTKIVIAGAITTGICVQFISYRQGLTEDPIAVITSGPTSIETISATPVVPKSTTIPVSRGVDREQFSQDKVISAIKNNLGGAFQGKSNFIYHTSKKNNVNPMLVSAIIKHETHNGTSQVCIIGNNPGGLIWYDGCPYKKYGIFIHYPSLDKGIEDMVRQLKTFYIDKGLTTIEKIQKVYCPEGASNDPTNLNVHWLPNVTKTYLKILEEAK